MKARGFLLLFLLAGLFCFAPDTALAQNQASKETSFVLQRFRPSFDPDGVYNTFGGESLGQWRWHAGLFLNFGFRPLIITGGRVGIYDIVNWQLGADLSAGIGLLDMKWIGIDLSLYIPMSPFVSITIPDDINCAANTNCTSDNRSSFAFGDISAALKLRILGEKWYPLGLAIIVGLQFPSGDKERFHSESTVSVHPRLAISKTLFSIWRIAANVGFRYRPTRTFIGLTTSSEITMQAGTSIMISKDRFGLMFEAISSIPTNDIRGETIPLELLGGIKIHPTGAPTHTIHLGGSAGLIPGYGVPTFRVFAGYTYTAPRAELADRDGDGVVDIEDNCPDQPGSKANKGCPSDKDGDGIIDKRDKCPDEPGPRENRGCPWGDADKDGVADHEDRCPQKPGPADNNGCPWGDTDGDGLKDNVDQCPKQFGPKENNGCPDKDRDSDTIVDRKDKCPNIPGPKENDGCPKKLFIKVDSGSKKILLLEKVYFATGSARIKKKSYPILNQVHAVLNSNPQMRIRIEGHTDDRGSAKFNQGLSQRRVNSVRRYLINKGVGAGRLVAKGFGEDRPIATNSTRDGRAKNRRVEFHIIQ